MFSANIAICAACACLYTKHMYKLLLGDWGNSMIVIKMGKVFVKIGSFF